MEQLRALVVRQPWANQILAGTKKVEYRSWKTNYRGPVLIIAGRARSPEVPDGPYGVTLCLVDLVEVRSPSAESDFYQWALANPRRVIQKSVVGRLGLYSVPMTLVQSVRTKRRHQSSKGSVMRDFVVYHNTEHMGRLGGGFRIISNKNFKDLIGDRVWLISGEGRPRRYYLEYSFVIDKVEPDPEDESTNLISGKKGDKYRPSIRLDQASWFPAFRRSQGSFAFGFNVIGSGEHVQALHGVVRRASGK